MPRPKQVERIGTGEVGYLVAAIKDLHDVRIGDTVTDAAQPGRRGAARLSSRSSRWSSAIFTPAAKRNTKNSAMPWIACS